MSETNRSYRIKANVNEDTFIDVNLNQNIEVFEMLSLKITSENFYKLHTADYGCVAGRVLANGGVGVPNAKLSIFIAMDDETRADDVLSYLYPYSSSYDRNADGVRYNLLPEDKLTDCHQNIGTFPSKRLVLDDDNVLEIFDKYYKFTTTTNVSGDYLIFGVPTGSQTLHMDLDLSDIGDLLSQKPKDLLYKGYNNTMFENANMFKADKAIDGLPQVFTQTESVYVYPFWGEKEEMGETNSNGVRITRKDINVDYKFEPTCVFIGSLVTDEKSNGFTKRCIPTERMGKMDRITTGEGTIEMIRKTTDGSVESYTILGNQLIDGNGTWCYQIPMNLDYVTTDEYGNIVPTDDPNKGVPTRARVRFRFSLTDFESDYQNSHLVKVLVPNNPHNISSDREIDYVFGTNTSDNEEGTASFRDLFYNNVYTVKSYIPRLQHRNFDKEKRFSGIKAVNVNVGNNPIPYNNMRIDITFLFTLQCAIMHILIWIVKIVNRVISGLYSIGRALGSSCGKDTVGLFSNLRGCVTIGDGMCPDLENWYFAPGCKNQKYEIPVGTEERTLAGKMLPWHWGKGGGEKVSYGERSPLEDALNVRTLDQDEREGSDEYSIENNNSEKENLCITSSINHFMQCIEISLAQEYEVIQFDFYNDWINGLLYIPRWFARIRKKRSFLFGLIKTREKLQACVEGNVGYQRKYVQQCALSYARDEKGKYTNVTTKNGCHPSNDNKFKCHKKKGRKYFKIQSGYVRPENTSREQTVYYFKPCTIGGGLYNQRNVKLFATDIVLLGSLSDRNVNGIPQSFKELVSSTYQMPTNIAATNLGHIGYMFSTKDGSYLCNNKIETNGVTVQSQTFNSEQNWIRGMDYDEDYSDDEYAVTESAGIDWGYTGPGQEYAIKTKKILGITLKSVEEQNRSTLYQPGGHFLGISCTASEANVKSCINLSRVCEIGVSISSRQHVPDRNGDGLSYNAVTIPTGVISRDEINDDGFRSEFATMNFNGLETMVDPVTRRRIYKFDIMNPRNFDGAFGKISKGRTEYNDFSGKYEEDNKTKAYKRTVETNNVDYYDFRLGWHGGTEAELKQKYLINDGSSVSLPMYENSFYFYFGLHDGSTALDRFFKEYFAECPDMVNREPVVRVETTPGDTCEGKLGSVALSFIGFEEDVRYALKQRNPDTGYIPVNGNIFNRAAASTGTFITDPIPLSPGDYTIDVYLYEGESVIATKDFAIPDTMMRVLNDIEYDVIDYSEEIEENRMGPSTNGNGYFEFSGIDSENIEYVYITNGNEYASVKGNYHPAGLTEKSGFVVGEKVYAWRGNTDYTVYAGIKCANNTVLHQIGTSYIRMPIRLDVQIGPYSLTTYKNLKKLGYNAENDGWWKTLLGSSVDARHKWSVEHAITYDATYSNMSTGKIDVTEIGGNIPYDRVVKGNGERVDENGNVIVSPTVFGDKEEAYANGWDLSENGFNVPTLNFPSNKTDYLIRFSDAENGQVESSVIPSDSSYLRFPSVYRPFHVKYIVFRTVFGGSVTSNYSLTIYNGSPYNNEFKIIEANSYTAAPQDRIRPAVNWGAIDSSSNRVFTTMTKTWTSSRLDTTVYFANVEESAPDGNYGNSVSINENVAMPSDGTTNLTTGTRFYFIYKRNQYGAKVSDGISIPSSPFQSLRLVPEGITSVGQEYKGSVVMKAFEVTDGNGNRYYFEPGNEIDRNKIFAGNMSDIENVDPYNTLIAAIYDPWTNLGDDEYSISQNAGSKYEYVNNDETSLSVISIYDKEGFMRVQGNPEVFPSNNEYYLVNFEHRMEIVENGVISTGSDSSFDIYPMGSFQVNDNTDMVSIPNIRITLNAYNVPLNNGRVAVFIVDRDAYNSMGLDRESYTDYMQHVIFFKEYNGVWSDDSTSYEFTREMSMFTAGDLRTHLGTSAREFYIVAAVDLGQEVSHLETGTFIVRGEGANVDYEAAKITVTKSY